MRDFVTVSASQIDAFQDCRRLWWLRWRMGLPVPTRPSAQLGSDVHVVLADYLSKGKPPEDTPAGRIANAGLVELPLPGTVEVEVDLRDAGLKLADVPVLGYIDVLDVKADEPVVLDHKTLSNWRYALNEEQLLRAPQMIIYAKTALTQTQQQQGRTPHAVQVGHVAYLTKGVPLARKTVARMDIDCLEEGWSRLTKIVEEMKTVSKAHTPDEVEPTWASCDKYGGCHFRDHCRVIGSKKTPSTNLKEKTMNGPNGSPTAINPLDALAALKARSGAALSLTPEPPASPPVSAAASQPLPSSAEQTSKILDKYRLGAGSAVTPPDAPPPSLSVFVSSPAQAPQSQPPIQPAPAEAPKQEGVARRPRNYQPRLHALGWDGSQVGRMTPLTMHEILDGDVRSDGNSILPDGTVYTTPPAAPAEEAVAQPQPSSEPALPVKPTTVHPILEPVSSSLIVYVDCVPDRGRDRDFVHLEDIVYQKGYMAAAVEAYNKAAPEKEHVNHYSLIPYNRGPAFIASHFLIERPKGVVVANTRFPATSAILEVLVPVADVVVRAIR